MASSIMAHPAFARVLPRLFDGGNAVVRPRPTIGAQSAGRRRRGGRKPARVEKGALAPKANGRLATSSYREAVALVSARSILDECVTVTSLIEVALHSVEQYKVEYPGPQVLKRALRVMWVAHRWVDGSNPDLGDEGAEDDDGGDL